MSRLFLSSLVMFLCFFAGAQDKCPANIGFELGSFEGWECSQGSIARVDGSISLSPSIPTYNRHTLIANTANPILDSYGGFPVNSPNGSGFSIQLGNSSTGGLAERVSYTFTIPSDQNNYSIIYDYAVVFQDPGHQDWEQPKFTANVYDLNTGSYIGCSSFSFTASAYLPGFKESTVKDSVFYKEWTPVTIKLSGLAGRTIRIEFTTNDCARGGHFGYAYVDVNQNCTAPISGNVFCPNTEKMTLVAPYGFAEYKWFNDRFSSLLGQDSKLSVDPIPLPNTKYAVEVTPFPGQGCLDTIYTTVVYSGDPLDLVVKPNITACVTTGADITAKNITAGSSSGLMYSYYLDANRAKYLSTPKNVSKSGNYYIQAENNAGCTVAKMVSVHIEPLPVFKVADPPTVYRPETIDLSKAATTTGVVYNYSFWHDSLTTKEMLSPKAVDKTGRYFIKGHSTLLSECAATQPVQVKILDPLITAPNIFTPNGDGLNDEWRIPQLSYYPECLVEVYNRSGGLVFRSNIGYTQPWDGKFNGKELPVATYYYVIKLNNELPVLGGSITIVR
jgi:gliding motility-associated-like protein